MKVINFFILSFLINLTAFADTIQSISKRYELLAGVRHSKETKNFWDQKFSNTGKYVFGKSPAKFLSKNFNYIPPNSKILDVGMGEGRNAVFLARKGYKVTGVDISSAAIRKASRLAQEFGVRIKAVNTSMQNYKVEKGSFDSIICFYYVDRELSQKFYDWLRPGGVLIFESHTDHQRKIRGSEQYEEKYLLRPGELLKLFPRFNVLKYEEPLHAEEYTASIILQKPVN